MITEILILTVLLIAAVVWLAMRNGRQRTEVKFTKDALAAVRKAEEIENEVEALDRDTLKSRARKWVRAPGK